MTAKSTASTRRPGRRATGASHNGGGMRKRTRAHHARHGDRRKQTNRWSNQVTETSDAMDLQQRIFKEGSADEIAASLKKSSETSRRRKASPFQSAMSMLNFYINRAGKNLPKSRRTVLETSKKRLREAFGRKP